MNPEQLLGNVVALVVLGMILLVTLAVMAFVCHLISDAQKSLPFEHQKIQPGLVWLMMIPCVNIVMNFFVFIQVPASFDSFFRSRGEMPDTSLGTLGIIYAILATLSPIPTWAAVSGSSRSCC